VAAVCTYVRVCVCVCVCVWQLDKEVLGGEIMNGGQRYRPIPPIDKIQIQPYPQ
jgi:hypothetical protein